MSSTKVQRLKSSSCLRLISRNNTQQSDVVTELTDTEQTLDTRWWDTCVDSAENTCHVSAWWARCHWRCSSTRWRTPWTRWGCPATPGLWSPDTRVLWSSGSTDLGSSTVWTGVSLLQWQPLSGLTRKIFDSIEKIFDDSDAVQQRKTELVLLEGSSAGNKLFSFTTGGDLLMGRNIIRRSVSDCFTPIILMTPDMRSTTVLLSQRDSTWSTSTELSTIFTSSAQHCQWSVSWTEQWWGVEQCLVSTQPGVWPRRGQYHVMVLLKIKALILDQCGVCQRWALLVCQMLDHSTTCITDLTSWGPCSHSLDTGSIEMISSWSTSLVTVSRLSSSSIAHAGLASHFCLSELIPRLRQDLLHTRGDNSKVKEILDDYQHKSWSEDKEQFMKESLNKTIATCDRVYNTDDVREIYENLTVINNEWSNQQLTLLNKACPLSLK